MVGDIVVNGVNNAVAYSVNRAAAFLADRPVVRCKFGTTMVAPAFPGIVGEIVDFTGETWTGFDEPGFAGGEWASPSDYIEWIRREKFLSGPIGTSPYHYYAMVYSLSFETISNVRTWLLQRFWYDTDNLGHDINYNPMIHSAWTAPWRTAFSNTPQGGTHGTLTFSPMAAADYIAWWMQGTARAESYQDVPGYVPSSERPGYHAYLGADSSISCGIDIM